MNNLESSNEFDLGKTLLVSGIVGISMGLSMLVYGRCDDRIVLFERKADMSQGYMSINVDKTFVVGSIFGLGLVSAYAAHRFLQK